MASTARPVLLQGHKHGPQSRCLPPRPSSRPVSSQPCNARKPRCSTSALLSALTCLDTRMSFLACDPRQCVQFLTLLTPDAHRPPSAPRPCSNCSHVSHSARTHPVPLFPSLDT